MRGNGYSCNYYIRTSKFDSANVKIHTRLRAVVCRYSCFEYNSNSQIHVFYSQSFVVIVGHTCACASTPMAYVWDNLDVAHMWAALRSDDVAAVRRVCRMHAAHFVAQREHGGIYRYVLRDACQYGAVNVITWVVETCGPATFRSDREGIESQPIVRCRAYQFVVSGTTREMKFRSVLHAAACCSSATAGGHVRTVRCLLDLHADIEQVNHKGETPLVTLLRHNWEELASLIEPVGPRPLFRSHRDYALSCLCLLLHRGAEVAPSLLTTYAQRAPALARYLAAPPRDYPGISRCSSGQAMDTRHALVLAWRLAQRQPRSAHPLFGALPFEILKQIAQHVGPFLAEPTRGEIHRALMSQMEPGTPRGGVGVRIDNARVFEQVEGASRIWGGRPSSSSMLRGASTFWCRVAAGAIACAVLAYFMGLPRGAAAYAARLSG